MINGFEEFQKISKDNVDVALKSFGAVSKGMQTIASEVADISKKNFETSSAAMEKVFAAKSFDKAFEVQSEYVRSAYEEYVGQMTKLGELYAGVAKEAYKPFESAASKFEAATAKAAK